MAARLLKVSFLLQHQTVRTRPNKELQLFVDFTSSHRPTRFSWNQAAKKCKIMLDCMEIILLKV